MDSIAGRELQAENSRYKVLHKVGQGGMASVYKGTNLETNEAVAVKVLAQTSLMDSNMLHRFRREIRLAMEYNHPHIVRILDYGEEDGVIFLIMPLLEGGNLATKLKSGDFSPVDGMKAIDQISKALQYIHTKGVVHRDVKPANILYDSEGNAYLADFGLASHKEASISLTGSALIGTPAYMAPEQAKGNDTSSHTDQYAMGITLFLMLTGQLPFKADTPIGTIFKHINESLPSIRELKPNIPEVLEKVVLKATAKEPQERFDSMTAFNNAFQAAMRHTLDPVNFSAPEIQLSPMETIIFESEEVRTAGRKRQSRTPMVWAGVAAIVLVVTAGILFIGSQLAGSMATDPTETIDPAVMTQLVADFDLMSTEAAKNDGEGLTGEQMETAMVQTLAVLQSQTSAVEEGNNPAATLEIDVAGEYTSTPTPSSELTQTIEGDKPHPTSTPTPTTEATSEQGSNQTATATIILSPTATSTLAATRTHTPTPTQTQTRTPTLVPTATNTMLPTKTDVPIDSCTGLTISSFATSRLTATWKITNNSGNFTHITRISIAFPASNGHLQSISYDGLKIWSGSETSPADISSNWVGTIARREILDRRTKVLGFDFEQSPSSLGYNLLITFSNGCTLLANH